MLFQKFAVTGLAMLLMGAVAASAAPVSVEKASVGVTLPQQPAVGETAEAGALSAHQATAFALFKDKPATDIAEKGTKGGSFMSSVPLPPAVLLFGGALGAIFWLGRRRKQDNSNWE